MSELTVEHDSDCYVLPSEFSAHMRKVDLMVGILAGLMNAMAVNPMMAGFIPPDVKAQIAEFVS